MLVFSTIAYFLLAILIDRFQASMYFKQFMQYNPEGHVDKTQSHTQKGAGSIEPAADAGGKETQKETGVG
jgi:hypothetical protein